MQVQSPIIRSKDASLRLSAQARAGAVHFNELKHRPKSFAGVRCLESALLEERVNERVENPEGVDGGVFERIKKAIGKDRPRFLSQFLENFYNADIFRGKQISDQVIQLSWNIAAGASPKGPWTVSRRGCLKRMNLPPDPNSEHQAGSMDRLAGVAGECRCLAKRTRIGETDVWGKFTRDLVTKPYAGEGSSIRASA